MFRPGVWSLREPALLFGAAGLWLFFLLLRRMAGARAAVIGCGLLAVDAAVSADGRVRLGTGGASSICCSWAAVLLLLRFYQEGSALWLAGGFLLLGLAMWDKAVAI